MMTLFPYPVGAKVAGADCIGNPFQGTVTEILGPYTVKLDGLYVTPVSLISGAVENDSPLGDEFAAGTTPVFSETTPVFAESPDSPETAAPASGQLSLF